MVDPFDNDWSAVASTPPHRFQSISFREILSWSASWELNDNIKAVVRFNHDDGRIEERAFSTYSEAEAAMSSHNGDYIAYDSDYLFDPNSESVEED